MANNKNFQHVAVSYKGLKRLSIGDRVSLASSASGASILSSLTPEQYASLFPSYYLHNKPNIAGFYAALTKKTQENTQNRSSSWWPFGSTATPTQPPTTAPSVATAKSAAETKLEGGQSNAGQPRTAIAGSNNKEIAMKAFAAELKAQGVPAANIPYAVAALAGQVHVESGFNPNAVHDNGTGYGIYGARDPRPGVGRKTDMLNWMKQNGYESNSIEGQARFMVHEAMTKREYAATRNALMNANKDNADKVSHTLTHNFENPAEKEQNTRVRTAHTLAFTAEAQQHSQSVLEGSEASQEAASPAPAQQESTQASSLVAPADQQPGTAVATAADRGTLQPPAQMVSPDSPDQQERAAVPTAADIKTPVAADGGKAFTPTTKHVEAQKIESVRSDGSAVVDTGKAPVFAMATSDTPAIYRPDTPMSSVGPLPQTEASEKIKVIPEKPLKGDNSVVLDDNKKPLFTMNTERETAKFEPQQKTVEVRPLRTEQPKAPTKEGVPVLADGGNVSVRNDPNSLVPPTPEPPPTPAPQEINNHTTVVQQQAPRATESIYERTMALAKEPIHCPSFKRAISESNFTQTDTTGLGVNHYGSNIYGIA